MTLMRKGPLDPHDTRLGLKENVEAALSYVGLFVTGIIFYILEEENRFIRFHAMQSILVFVGLLILETLLRILWIFPFIGYVLWRICSVLLGVLGVILWLVLIFQAFNGKTFKIPIIGDYAEKYA